MSDTDAPTQTGAEADRDIASANSAGRLLLGGVIALALILIAAFQFYAFPLLKSAVSNTAPAATIATAKILFIGIAAATTLTTLVWIGFALRILRHRQDPPPHACLWRDTKIVRGAPAVWRAWLSIAAAVLAGAACLGCAVYVVIALDRLAPPASPPAGIATAPPGQPAGK